jgi:transposase InsO family protein
VTRAGYYAWRRRSISARDEQNRQLLLQITRLFTKHRGAYGSPRIHQELALAGTVVSRHRVARLMRAAGLRGRVVRIYRGNPTLHHFYGQHPNRVRTLRETRRNRVWVGDITYLPVGGQWRYLAVVMDRYSRRVLAWALARHRDARLTRAVLEAAVARRRPPSPAVARRHPRPGLIFHSDRGSEYSASLFRDCLVHVGALQSSALRGPGENAHMESCFHSFKAERVHGVQFTTVAALRQELRRYIYYYNHQRLHSALGYRSPVDYESRSA